MDDLDIVDRFRPYRVAANWVNVQKHGTRGRNRPSSRTDFYALLLRKAADADPKPEDAIADLQSLINFNGSLWEVMDVADRLIRLWDLFLRSHTSLDLDDFVREVQPFMVPGLRRLSVGASDSVGNLEPHAKQLDAERKALDL